MSRTKYPAQFGRLVSVAIVNPEGKVLAAAPTEAIPLGSPLQPQLLPEATASFQAALRGETDPAKLAIRRADGHVYRRCAYFRLK